VWRHIQPDGQPAYERTWAWAGNFQGGRAAVRCDGAGSPPRYAHILPDGALLSEATYAYAGDFREGYAVVRDADDGLCDHIDARGARMGRPGPLFDLDVFHKGFARARDAGGWFFIHARTGRDAMARPGARYAQLEPLYNGVAAAQRHDGARVLLRDEDAQCAAEETQLQPGESTAEHAAALHETCVAYWAPLAVRMGLDAGLAQAEGGNAHNASPLVQSWQQLGLLDAHGALTPRGLLLLPEEPERVARDRADFWLRDMLPLWLDAALLPRGDDRAAQSRLCVDPEHLFSQPRVQRVLDSYARDDWAGLAAELPLRALAIGARVVDVGGGLGALARAVKAQRPDLDVVLADLPPVAQQAAEVCAAAGVRCVGVNLLQQGKECLPPASLDIMSRVLHDWPDEQAAAMLRAVRRAAPPGATLCVLERDAPAGLLSLHMSIVHGSRERSADEWRPLFARGGWALRGEERHHAAHAVMCLRPV